MSWNYRIIKSKQGFQVHEVYYDSKGKPDAWTKEEVSPHGETLCKLSDDFEHYKEAFNKPVLVLKGNKLTTLKTKK